MKHIDKSVPASIVSSVLSDSCRSEMIVEDAAVELVSLFLLRLVRSYMEKVMLLNLKISS